MVEKLNKSYLIHWLEYSHNLGIFFFKYIRRDDNILWVGHDGEDHSYLKTSAGDSRRDILDAGCMKICFTDKGPLLEFFDSSGTLNIGKDKDARQETIDQITAELQGLVVAIVNGPIDPPEGYKEKRCTGLT